MAEYLSKLDHRFHHLKYVRVLANKSSTIIRRAIIEETSFVQINETVVLPSVSPQVPTGMPANIPLPKPAIEDPLLIYQFRQLQQLQNQQLFLRMRSAAIAKLSQSEHWSTLSPAEQSQLVYQYISTQEPEVPEIQVPTNSFVAPPLATAQPSNPVIQFINQMHQVGGCALSRD